MSNNKDEFSASELGVQKMLHDLNACGYLGDWEVEEDEDGDRYFKSRGGRELGVL